MNTVVGFKQFVVEMQEAHNLLVGEDHELLDEGLFNGLNAHKAAKIFASHSHNEWYYNFQNDPNVSSEEKKKPRMRLRGKKMVDVNKPAHEVDDEVLKDNYLAGLAAHKAVIKHPKDSEKGSAYIHDQWIKRNRKDKSIDPSLFKSYRDLPDHEKDKDRRHYNTMKEIHRQMKLTR